LSFLPNTPAASATWQSWWTQHEAYSSLTAHLMLPCHHHAFQRTDCPLLPFSSIFSPVLAFVCLLWFEKISSPSASNGRCSSSFILDLHQTTQSFDLPIFFDHYSCSNFNKLSHTTTVGLSSSPQNFTCPRPAEWNNRGADIITSPSSLLALLIFAVLVVLTTLVIWTQLLLSLPCA